jgi:hypothetical protein
MKKKQRREMGWELLSLVSVVVRLSRSFGSLRDVVVLGATRR